MNKIEFKKIMNLFGNYHTLPKEIYLWNNLVIEFSGTYYTIIKGKVPYEVAQRIYEKYPQNEHSIRINGGYIDSEPFDYVTDEQYQREISQYVNEDLDCQNFLDKCKKSKKALYQRPNKNKYIDLYHIDTKEGLIILMTEILDYHNRQNNRSETEVAKTQEYITQINQEMLDYIDPNISIHEWMSTDDETSEDFNQVVSLDYETTFGRQFRNALNQFDAAVNPYTNFTLSTTDLDELSNYLNNVYIDIYPYSSKDDEEREHCCKMIIKDRKTENYTQHVRDIHGFSNTVTFKLGEDELFQAVHFYAANGENIKIGYYGKNCKNRKELRYNISLGTITVNRENPRPIKPHEVAVMYDEILKAITLAKQVTIENMKKKEQEMKLTK